MTCPDTSWSSSWKAKGSDVGIASNFISYPPVPCNPFVFFFFFDTVKRLALFTPDNFSVTASRVSEPVAGV
jgi:hypothetical protein